MGSYRPSYHFQTKVSVPCPLCGVFHEEKDTKKRREYVYPTGWVEQTGCQDCFDKTLAQAKEDAKEYRSFLGY